MKQFMLAAVLAAAAPALAGEAHVSVEVGSPGFYGHIEVGGFPAPRLMFPEPVLIEHHVHVVGPPVYLHVPPGHAKAWAEHCHAYGACGQRVYFVQDAWYKDVYVPAWHERHGGGKSHGGGKGHGHGNGNGHKH